MESLSSDGVGRFFFLSLIAADGSGEGGRIVWWLHSKVCLLFVTEQKAVVFKTYAFESTSWIVLLFR